MTATQERIDKVKELPENVVELVHYSHPALWTPVEEFDFLNPPVDPIEFAHVLTRSMLYHNGLGLSATQLGKSIRAFAMRTSPEITVCYNPEIVDVGEQFDSMEEGCLSFPGVGVKVPRFKSIRARFTQPNGQTGLHTFAGVTARVFQHELEHLEGLNFTRQASRIELDVAIRKAKKRGFSYTHGSFRGMA